MKYLPSIFKQQNANPDHQSVVNAITNALSDVKTATDGLQNELNITTADSIWLDLWGDWFGVKRMPGESDSAFSQRILSTLTQDKITIPAMVNLLKNVLGQDTVVTVTEPYTQTFLLGNSKLNEANLQDGVFYRIGVVSITVNKPMTAQAYALLQLMKAAGTQVYCQYQGNFVFPWQVVPPYVANTTGYSYVFPWQMVPPYDPPFFFFPWQPSQP